MRPCSQIGVRCGEVNWCLGKSDLFPRIMRHSAVAALIVLRSLSGTRPTGALKEIEDFYNL